MALINCPDCQQEISDSAPSCTNCGRPIASASDVRGAGTSLMTTQGTAKRFKIQGLFATALIIIGIVWLITAVNANPEGSGSDYGAGILTVGILWYIVNRVRIWWHHS